MFSRAEIQRAQRRKRRGVPRGRTVENIGRDAVTSAPLRVGGRTQVPAAFLPLRAGLVLGASAVDPSGPDLIL